MSRSRAQRDPKGQLALDIGTESPTTPPESFGRDGTDIKTMYREVRDANGKPIRSPLAKPKVTIPNRPSPDNYDLWWLRSLTQPEQPSKDPVRVVDLFSGCGGLSLGIREAARATNRGFQVALANDIDPNALAVFEENFDPVVARGDSLENLVGDSFEDPTSSAEEDTEKLVGGPIDFLIGGPPCQGHSDLNNHTRRDDPKNALYVRMARAARLFLPRHVIIENVPGVRHDKNDIVGETWRRLDSLHDGGKKKYTLSAAVLSGVDFGVPQTRRRYFLVATVVEDYELETALEPFKLEQARSLEWAIKDLVDSPRSAETIFDTPSKPTPLNQARMNWFFKPGREDEHNLPNEERPDCHRLKRHSYVGVYGRMHWEQPAPTITGGFGCSGQGRFIHPKPLEGAGRTLTPHEAARVQFFPDFFKFDAAWKTERRGRGTLHQMIGNAVPSKFAYVIALSLLLADRR